MRGRFEDQDSLFSYLDPEDRIPRKHPLRRIRRVVREVLAWLSDDFDAAYPRADRPSIPPEMLLSQNAVKPINAYIGRSNSSASADSGIEPAYSSACAR